MPLEHSPPSATKDMEKDNIKQKSKQVTQTATASPLATSDFVNPYLRSTTLQAQSYPQSKSETDLTDLSNEFVTNRKRKHGDEQERFMKEMENIFHSKSCELRSNKTDSALQVLQTMMNELLKQNSEIKESITFVLKQYEDIKVKMDTLETEKKEDRKYIHRLEERVDNLESMLCANKIEIRNIPLAASEDEEELAKIVQNTTQVIGITLKRSEIKNVYCDNKKDKASKIVVDLVSCTVKEIIIKKARQFNSSNKQNKLSSLHLNIDAPATPIFISEFLSPQAQHLFYLARKFAKEQCYMYCWTSAGKICLRKAEKRQANNYKT